MEHVSYITSTCALPMYMHLPSGLRPSGTWVYIWQSTRARGITITYSLQLDVGRYNCVSGIYFFSIIVLLFITAALGPNLEDWRPKQIRWNRKGPKKGRNPSYPGFKNQLRSCAKVYHLYLAVNNKVRS